MKEDGLRKIALVAEIVSALAIVLSLIFVGLQVRQGAEETAANSRALEASVRESMMTADLSILQSQLSFPHIARHNLQGVVIEDADEISQLTTYFHMMVRSRENYWIQYTNDMLDADTYFAYREAFLVILERSDLHLSLWNESPIGAVPGFVADINEQLAIRGRVTSSD